MQWMDIILLALGTTTSNIHFILVPDGILVTCYHIGMVRDMLVPVFFRLESCGALCH